MSLRNRHQVKHHSFEAKENKYDLTTLATVGALVVIGLILVYDSSVVQAFKDFDQYKPT